jgi:hypothetical protein
VGGGIRQARDLRPITEGPVASLCPWPPATSGKKESQCSMSSRTELYEIDCRSLSKGAVTSAAAESSWSSSPSSEARPSQSA